MAVNFYSTHNYFEALFNKAKENIILLMDGEGVVTAINKAFTLCFGYTEKDIVGKTAAILFTEEDLKRGFFEKELKNVRSKGQSFDNNYLVNKNKTLTWVSGESILVDTKEHGVHIVKLIQNIHEQKVSENELRRLNDLNENILGAIEDGVVVLDEQMNIIKVNDAFANLFEYSAKENTLVNFTDLIQPYDANNHLIRAIQNAIQTKKAFSNNHIEIDTPAGNKRIFELSCTPMQSNGNRNVLLIVHDITINKQLEREREDVMGFVAHELRNPLSNVILCNEIMSEAIKDNKTEVMNHMLARSKNNISRLQKMIAELYEATRINSGYLPLEISTFNFSEIVKEAIDTVEVLQPAYNIIVHGNGDIQVKGDRYRLIQVITNYVSNGIKYSNNKKELTITIQSDENSLIFSLRDEGVGISKEQLPYVFERFFRVEKTRSIEGIGLGLYLCRQIIHAHKGQLWAESELGKGSTFYFSIPLNN